MNNQWEVHTVNTTNLNNGPRLCDGHNQLAEIRRIGQHQLPFWLVEDNYIYRDYVIYAKQWPLYSTGKTAHWIFFSFPKSLFCFGDLITSWPLWKMSGMGQRAGNNKHVSWWGAICLFLVFTSILKPLKCSPVRGWNRNSGSMYRVESQSQQNDLVMSVIQLYLS